MEHEKYRNFFDGQFPTSFEGVYRLKSWVDQLSEQETDEALIDTGIKCAASFFGECIIAEFEAKWIEDWKVKLDNGVVVHTGEQISTQYFERGKYSIIEVFQWLRSTMENPEEIRKLIEDGKLDFSKYLHVTILKGKGFQIEQGRRSSASTEVLP